MFLFQIPWLPEWFLQRGRYQFILDSLQDEISKDAFTASDVETYREAFEQPGAMRAMLNWYRAAFRWLPPRLAHPKVLAQTLILWGRKDPHLGIELGRQSVHQCTRAYFEEFSDAGHFVHQDAAWQVNQAIYQFLREE
jgi:pimeloyl-ACP methyl ester carboxylesterase